jgi:diacylglycerol kinase (ATP)
LKKVRFVYNPVAGKKQIAAKLDTVIGSFQAKGWEVLPYRTTGEETCKDFMRLLAEEETEALLVAGGDGTIHRVMNGLIQAGLDTPLGIIPTGTANDFGVHLNLPQDVVGCCDLVLRGKTAKIDVGLANETYFLNVASAGLLTDIPHQTDVGMKNVLGRLAYYLKSIEKLPNFKPVPMEIISRRKVYREEVLLFLIVNGRTAGSFPKIAPKASVIDGLLDVLIFRQSNLGQLFSVFLKLLKGEHINDPLVEYFQTEEIIINCPVNVDTDLDGEAGPNFPLEVRVLPRKLNVFLP